MDRRADPDLAALQTRLLDVVALVVGQELVGGQLLRQVEDGVDGLAVDQVAGLQPGVQQEVDVAAVQQGGHQMIVAPPSTTRIWPVMWPPASEASSSAGPIRSVSPPSLPSGVSRSIRSLCSPMVAAVIFDGK
jgi:hypothetical protein